MRRVGGSHHGLLSAVRHGLLSNGNFVFPMLNLLGLYGEHRPLLTLSHQFSTKYGRCSGSRFEGRDPRRSALVEPQTPAALSLLLVPWGHRSVPLLPPSFHDRRGTMLFFYCSIIIIIIIIVIPTQAGVL